MNFKDYLIEFDDPQIYCDMDGVLADFSGAFKKQFGGEFSDARWPDLPVDWFLNLRPSAKSIDFLCAILECRFVVTI